MLKIAIPTFNRANKLDKSLGELIGHINKLENKQLVSVFVSNSGSTDETQQVIEKYYKIFEQNRIPFSSYRFHENCGFNASLLKCYENCTSDYIWFISDDDFVRNGAIEKIIDDVGKFNPNVIYYNFNQPPYDLQNPYIKETVMFEEFDLQKVQSIKKITDWPKLTSLVIKKLEVDKKINAYGLKHEDNDYMHVAIALQTGFDHGKILHSTRYLAEPNADYKSQINFLPYIGNRLINTLKKLLDFNKKEKVMEHLELTYTDPLISSLNTLGNYYRGKFILSHDLKHKLFLTVSRELKSIKIHKIKFIKFFYCIIRFVISYTYYLGILILTRKRITKDRTTNN